MREGVIQPRFAGKFFRIDFDASPMPVLCLYPVPTPLDLEAVRLEVCGFEQHPRLIPWEMIASLPRVRLRVPIICQIFNWSEVVEWEGIRLADLLEFLKIEAPPNGYYAFYSRDGVYFETLSRDEARDPRVLLAFGLNGAPLPEPHGGPLRLVVPFLQGYKSVKWVGAIRAFRNDPGGIKRLLGQSPSSRLNDEWLARFKIQLPAGAAGDPPPLTKSTTDALKNAAAPSPPQPPVSAGSNSAGGERTRGVGRLCEIIAILRPQKHIETRRALEAAGFPAYTTVSVLGRNRQGGLRFRDQRPGSESGPAIKFLPKRLFTIVVPENRLSAAVAAIRKANVTGQAGDGRIFVLGVEDAVRFNTDERGGDAV